MQSWTGTGNRCIIPLCLVVHVILVVLGATDVEHHKLYCLLSLTNVLILIEGIGLGLCCYGIQCQF
jgi:hypothetical protein